MNAKLMVIAVSFFALVTSSMAKEVTKTVSSFDITPCSRTTTYKDDFGITWPTVEFAAQTVDLKVKLSGSGRLTLNEIEETFNVCDQVALGVAIAAGTFAANPEAFVAGYDVSFKTCAVARLASEVTGISVNVESSCHW